MSTEPTDTKTEFPRMLRPRQLAGLPATEFTPPAERERLQQLEKVAQKVGERIEGSRLGNIFADLKELTYGDLKKFAAIIGAEPDKVWDGACKGEGDNAA